MIRILENFSPQRFDYNIFSPLNVYNNDINIDFETNFKNFYDKNEYLSKLKQQAQK